MVDKKLLLKMNVQEIFKRYTFIGEIFGNYGLKCKGCPFAERVTLEDALESSTLPSKDIIDEIVRYLEERSQV